MRVLTKVHRLSVVVAAECVACSCVLLPTDTTHTYRYASFCCTVRHCQRGCTMSDLSEHSICEYQSLSDDEETNYNA